MGFGKSTIILNGFVMGSKGFSKESGHSDEMVHLKMGVPPNALGEVGNDDSPGAPTMCRMVFLGFRPGFSTSEQRKTWGHNSIKCLGNGAKREFVRPKNIDI